MNGKRTIKRNEHEDSKRRRAAQVRADRKLPRKPYPRVPVGENSPQASSQDR